MEKEYYKIKTSFASYFVEVWHQYPGIDKVYIGGKSRCVSISVYYESKEWSNIDGVGYNIDCNYASNHAKGVGTVHLVKCAIGFVTKYYGMDTSWGRFLLKDTSYIECNTCKIPLAPFYVLYHGKTWYEAKFGAQPTHSGHVLKEQKRELRKYIRGKPDISEYFNEGQKRFKAYVLGEYEGCNTLEELMKKFKDNDCSIFKGWLEQMVRTFIPSLEGSTWMIDGDTADGIRMVVKKTSKPMEWEGSGGAWVWEKSI